jgi:hypothetical protein
MGACFAEEKQEDMSDETVDAGASETTPSDTVEQSRDSGEFTENLAKAVAKANADDGAEPVESKTEEKPAPPAKEKKLAPKFVALRKRAEEAKAREEQVRNAAAQLQAREAQVLAYEKQLREREAKAAELEELAADPRKLLGWIKEKGLSFEDLSVAAISENDPAIRTELDLKRQAAEVAELRKQLEQRDAERKRELEELSTREQRAYVAAQERAFVETLQTPGFEVCDEAYGEDEQLRVAYHLNSLADKRGLGWGIKELAEATKELAEAGLTVNSRGEVVKNVRYERIRGRKPPTPTPQPVKSVTSPRTITPLASTERATEETSLDDLDWQARTRVIAERARRLG